MLIINDFARFFHALYDVDPFPWQTRLLQEIASENGWPDVLDLPTGSGKTAALDIAIFHLALEATKGRERRAPMRIAFVVDRRLIVDDTHKRAQKLARKLQEALDHPDSADPIVLKVATALQVLAGDGQDGLPCQPPLVVRKLRGGAPQENDWARTPVQPTILCSTVDQVGSRLLFRGYSVSPRMAPIHAGLLGSDCLILLDEAHLSQPFQQTLRSIARLRNPFGKHNASPNEGPYEDDSPFKALLLTATPGNSLSEDKHFTLGAKDREDKILRKRLDAHKKATLLEIPGKQGAEEVAKKAKEALHVLQGRGVEMPAIGIIVNRVARAREIFGILRDKLQGSAQVGLIIGPAREIDRREIAKALDSIRTGADRQLDKPLLIVATQTVEVGIDIDLDGLITEAAALDALRQRFGRLNRNGRTIEPYALILAHKEDIGAKADDPVYGDRIAKTWKLLKRLESELGGIVDFGIQAFEEHITKSDALQCSAPQDDAPVLLPAYVDLWSQTWPIPNADPQAALFLHGPSRSPADVQIVWRADVEYGKEVLNLLPPRASEAIGVPIWAVQAWLRKLNVPDILSDTVDGEYESEQEPKIEGRRVFRWAGVKNKRTHWLDDAKDIRPGDLIVVPSSYGGCDTWGWNPKWENPVDDVADAAARPYQGRRFAVRITPELIEQAIAREDTGESDKQERQERIIAIESDLREMLDAHAEETPRQILEAILQWKLLPKPIRRSLNKFLNRRKVRIERAFLSSAPNDRNDMESTRRGILFVAPFGLPPVGKSKKRKISDEAAMPITENDHLGSLPGYAQTLDDHAREVELWAHGFAKRAGISPPSLASDVALAAYLHDAGKVDPRFQAFLSGGDPLGWDEQCVLAKSGRWPLPPGAWKQARLPEDWRHETLSVRLAQRHKRFSEASDKALVLWLVGVHHGFGRPFFPHIDDEDKKNARDRPLPPALECDDWQLEPGSGPQSLSFRFEEMDWFQIFEHLKQRYGAWGLARLETFVRLADHRASEEAARTRGRDRYE